ncbi:hypothetical protein K503DRAFT_806519 [Rhizopogon vinicolor AM-OR11-026]|uniref:Uncharacterized protein n=1 Tax=Rhizopogon vinicolor AM-OR11-026 TaxID=1314800 RepID=A0A1B7MED9_9AGAM|nr:hypothetical protein K503DRAFT_806519 [Rhizopogon vinicolor AM-OR11-026]
MSVSTYDYKGGLRIPNLCKNTSLNAIRVILPAPPANDYTKKRHSQGSMM